MRGVLRHLVKVLALAALLIVHAAFGESDYCAGWRTGYLLEFCPANNRVCLNQKVQCPNRAGTFKYGFVAGRQHGASMKRLELSLVVKILRQAKGRDGR